ncbi:MAG: ABC transporter substrate-binding protein [Mesorhizobium sp.]
MKRFLFAASLSLLLASGAASAADTISVAGLFNLTGSQASLDEPTLQGAQLKVKEINDAGGVLGGQMLNIISYDTKSKQADSATAAKRAVEEPNVVAGIGYSDTTFVLAAAPEFQKAGIPFLTTGATAPSLPEIVGNELFLVPFGDNVQAWAMADYAYNDLKLKRIVLWRDKSMDYAVGLAKYFQERFEKLGGEIVLTEDFVTSDQDFSAQVTRLKSKAGDVDALYLSSGPDTVGVMVKQVRSAGLNLPILGGDGLDTPLLTEVPGPEMADDILYTTAALVPDRAKSFDTAFTAAYGVPPPNTFAALGYDGIGLLADAIKRAGSTDHEAVRAALAATDGYQGVTGDIRYSGDSNIPLKPVAIMKVNKGQVSLLTSVSP